MNYNGNRVVMGLEHALKEAIKMGAGGGVTTAKQQLEILEMLKKKPGCSADIDFNAPRAPLDTLIALCENGPLDDGDVPSRLNETSW